MVTAQATSLHTYLNDHLSGALAALQLLANLRDTAESAADRELFATLHEDITLDRGTLALVLERAGGTQSSVRQLGGWMAEKAGRLKLMLDDPSRAGLSRFEALEVLSLGIRGKRALWTALQAAQVPLGDTDLEMLVQRADEQFERVERARFEAARRVLRF